VARFLIFSNKTEKSGEKIMAQEFLQDLTGSARPNIDAGEDDRETVQILIISSPEGVEETIHTLFAKEFAYVDEWSPPQPTKKPGKVVSILTRYRKRRPIKLAPRKSGQ
jgi:hypothetical protein